VKVVTDHFRLAEAVVRIDWQDESLRAALGAALAHRAGPPAAAALHLTVNTRENWPSPGAGGRILADGAVGISVMDPARRVASRLDAVGAVAEFSCRGRAELPAYERAAPFRLILQRWLPSRGRHMLHAWAVGLPGRGAVLLAARSGGGKSNTTLACLGSPLQLLGEDFLAVDEAADPRVWSLYSTAKLHLRDLGRFPALAADAADGLDDIDGKALLQLAPRHTASLADGLPLRAILALKVTNRPESRIVPAPAGEAVKEMLTSLLMALPESRRPLFEFVTRLAHRLPVHRLELGTDVRGIPGVIADFLERTP
jgi:hypothetical protein